MTRRFIKMGVLVPGILLLGCAASGGGPGLRVAPPPPAAACAPFKEQAVRTIGPYSDAQGVSVYAQLHRVAQRLMGCRPAGAMVERTVAALAPIGNND